MILTSINEFKGGKEIVRTNNLQVLSMDYLKSMNLNKVFIAPLHSMSGNKKDDKLATDVIYMCIVGQGTVKIHDKIAPITVGSLFAIKKDEEYSIVNDSLDMPIVLLSIF